MLNLAKNKVINLSKSLPNIIDEGFRVNLSWKQGADLDVAVTVLDAEGKLITRVFYQKEFLTAAGITYSGDVRDGGVEYVDVSITDLVPTAAKLVFTVSSYSEDQPKMFGASSDPVAKLVDKAGNALITVKLDEECAFGTAIELLSIEQVDGSWSYMNVSEMIGSSVNGMQDVVNKYQ